MGTITDLDGIKVGHSTNLNAGTGCTAVLFESACEGAAYLSGGGTSTRQIDSLLPHGTYGKINAILLTGGSTFGLAATDGVLGYLEERGIGLKTGGGKVVPSVPSAVIYDLGLGTGDVRPDYEMGYSACMNASSSRVKQGSIGVGTGATIGKMKGVQYATKGGVGSESFTFPGGISVGVLVVVNAFGDVYTKERARIIAGVRSKNNKRFLNTAEMFKKGLEKSYEPYSSTTLCIVVTDAELSKQELIRVSKLSHTGVSRVINPVNTISDGDIVFSVSNGKHKGNANSIGIVAADLISDAIIKAVKSAKGLHGIPSHRELKVK